MTTEREIRYTLVTDGSSDAVLTNHLSWLLREHAHCALVARWADLSRLRRPPRGLSARIAEAVALYPCDLLFVHRDAEREPLGTRIAEIQSALASLPGLSPIPAVCVVPVRMLEAWLLFDEHAIRLASGNPNGHVNLALPHHAHVDALPDPKRVLQDALVTASDLSGRRRKSVATAQAVRRLGDSITDFSPLRVLPAFRRLEREVSDIVKANGW